MDTQKRLHENISALADGELPQSDHELALAALHTDDGRATWRAYHLTGDILRDQADGALSDGFDARLAAALACEPAYALQPADAADAGAAPFDTMGAPSEVQAEPNAAVIFP
ncbi:MAG: sigma-E factor negative regulatory protein [Duganella sp.]